MKIASACTDLAPTREAVAEVYHNLTQKLGGPPAWMTAYTTIEHNAAALSLAFKAVAPGVPLHGGSSCQGVMTETGFHHHGPQLGVLGVSDPAGAYGVGSSEDDAPREMGAAAARQALAAARLTPSEAKMIWLTCAPGNEEDVLAGIESVTGANTPIVGGSSADHDLSGQWRQFTHQRAHKNGVVVSALAPSSTPRLVFNSGYFATPKMGVVTKAEKRTILTINHRPAAQVYNEWTSGILQEVRPGEKILAHTSLYPLGRVIKQVGAVKYYQLSHPEAITAQQGLTLFTDIYPGDEITLLMGAKSGLIHRVGNQLTGARPTGRRIAGALVIFCAGCMLTIQDDMAQVGQNIHTALQGAPYLTAFTFGEQGSLGGINRHGNLMVSAVVFEE